MQNTWLMVTNIQCRMFCFYLHRSVSNTQEEHKVLKYFLKKRVNVYFTTLCWSPCFLTLKNKLAELSDQGWVEEGLCHFIKIVNFVFLKELQILP
jgi:hypothetical protein